MAYKRRYKRRKTIRRRGKYSRRRKMNFARRVRKVLMKNLETKFIDVGEDNLQLWHNIGQGTVVPLIPFTPRSIPGLFNVWSIIQPGTGRDQRVGDKIKPVGMSLTLFLEAKPDRPNTMYRIIVAKLPKQYNNAITGATFDPFQNTGTGNRMLLTADKDIGVRFMYDKIHRAPNQSWGGGIGTGAGHRSQTKYVRLWIRRKKSREIVFNQVLQAIVNNPVAVYVIPYEQHSTYETDNIANMDYRCRLYWKDP